ncbi:hypothetical protein KW797_00325 [Candidatus Parcubacteria bacterium]|nr:hypothetical protein [Candidatus Parcubacteria bacterium]
MDKLIAVLAVLFIAGCASAPQYEPQPTPQQSAQAASVPLQMGSKNAEPNCTDTDGDRKTYSAEECLEKMGKWRDFKDKAELAVQSKNRSAQPQQQAGNPLLNAALGAGAGALICNVGGRVLRLQSWERNAATAWCAAAGGLIGYSAGQPQVGVPYDPYGARYFGPGGFNQLQADRLMRCSAMNGICY